MKETPSNSRRKKWRGMGAKMKPEKPGRIVRIDYISKEFIRSHPDMLFVFGDALKLYGIREDVQTDLRKEKNVLGVLTRHDFSGSPQSYFTNGDFFHVIHRIDDAFRNIKTALEFGCDVVIPSRGIGTGSAQLPQRAPAIYAAIKDHIKNFESFFGTVKMDSEIDKDGDLPEWKKQLMQKTMDYGG